MIVMDFKIMAGTNEDNVLAKYPHQLLNYPTLKHR